jgi:tripartite ATP-independent transporter DctM subunit
MYAALASVSVGALFLATIIPGLLMAFSLALVVHFTSLRRGYGSDVEKSSGRKRWLALRATLPALILPIGIVGGVRFGVFTATEAGSIAVLYALIISFVFYEKPTLRQLALTARDAMMDTVSIMFIVAAAAPFAWVLVSRQVPQNLAMGLSFLTSQPVLLLLAINAFLLVVGLFIELFAALVILVPLLMPIVLSAGVDPVHFGIIICANLVMGALTPPMGVLAFVTARITKTDVVTVFRALFPFLLAMIAVLLLITYIPMLSLALPQLIRP